MAFESAGLTLNFTPQMTAEDTQTIDALRLFKLRLAVARYGEMDLAGWWNTKGVLGQIGKAGYGRGFPNTHYFAQARVVFAVAAARCSEVFNPPGCHTLWNLPPECEDGVNSHWQTWCGDSVAWDRVFAEIASIQGGDLLGQLVRLELVNEEAHRVILKLQLSAQNKAIQLPGSGLVTDHNLMLLAGAFGRGANGQLAVPYLRGD